MSKVAFELRADHEDFSGGSVSLPDRESFDLGVALKDGGGKISLNPDAGERKDEGAQEKENERAAHDAAIVAALDSHPALKRASADSGSASTEKKETS